MLTATIINAFFKILSVICCLIFQNSDLNAHVVGGPFKAGDTYVNFKIKEDKYFWMFTLFFFSEQCKLMKENMSKHSS